jgi:hypothetical protein
LNLFLQDPVSKERMKGSVSMSIDFDAQFLGKVPLEANQVQEGRSRRKLDEQVEIAPGRFLAEVITKRYGR